MDPDSDEYRRDRRAARPMNSKGKSSDSSKPRSTRKQSRADSDKTRLRVRRPADSDLESTANTTQRKVRTKKTARKRIAYPSDTSSSGVPAGGEDIGGGIRTYKRRSNKYTLPGGTTYRRSKRQWSMNFDQPNDFFIDQRYGYDDMLAKYTGLGRAEYQDWNEPHPNWHTDRRSHAAEPAVREYMTSKSGRWQQKAPERCRQPRTAAWLPPPSPPATSGSFHVNPGRIENMTQSERALQYAADPEEYEFWANPRVPNHILAQYPDIVSDSDYVYDYELGQWDFAGNSQSKSKSKSKNDPPLASTVSSKGKGKGKRRRSPTPESRPVRRNPPRTAKDKGKGKSREKTLSLSGSGSSGERKEVQRAIALSQAEAQLRYDEELNRRYGAGPSKKK